VIPAGSARPRRWLLLAACCFVGGAAGCGKLEAGSRDWPGEPSAPLGGALRVGWLERLTPVYEGPFIPVERAIPLLDPARDRIYVGSTAGAFVALTSAGGHVWRYEVGAAVEAAASASSNGNELYVVAEDGTVHALRASDGVRRWKEGTGDAIRQRPVVGADAVYVVNDTDRILAYARKDGALLWSHQQELPDGFSIAGRAGLTLVDGRLVTGFTDGTVAAFDAADGRVLWRIDTSLDVVDPGEGQPVFRDVDTTPVVVGDTLYVASFSSGLYALEARTGTVLHREPGLNAVVGMAAVGEELVVSSAEHGVLVLRLADWSTRWKRPASRGAPSAPVVHRGLVFVGESEGSLRALTLTEGREVGRIHSGTGFGAQPAVAGARGFALSNGGTLYAFTM
jgi:outer membrane protein assembly factor BamB